MTKYEKLIKKFKQTRKVSITGDSRIAEFKKAVPEHTVIREDEHTLVASFIVYSRIKYGALVSELIRTRYSIDEELAILRQKDEKPEEYASYFAFAEQCKADAKRLVAERDEK